MNFWPFPTKVTQRPVYRSRNAREGKLRTRAAGRTIRGFLPIQAILDPVPLHNRRARKAAYQGGWINRDRIRTLTRKEQARMQDLHDMAITGDVPEYAWSASTWT